MSEFQMKVTGLGFAPAQQHLCSAAAFSVLLAFTFDIDLFGARYIAGEPVDSRFNLYLLEHTFQWITGSQASLISPPIFYPYPFVLFFSDTHFGTSFIYILFRLAGYSDYHAFNLWFISGHFLSFWTCYYVLARWNCSALAAGLGACIFAFGIPSIAQMGHPQLVHRFCIPLAIYYAESLCRLRDPLSAFLAIWLLCWQLLINVYLGAFLAMVMLPFATFCLILNRGSILHFPLELYKNTVAFARGSTSKFVVMSLVTLTFLVATGATFGGHAFVARLYGFTRSWAEVETMLPRPRSYLLSEQLPYWPHLWSWPPALPMNWEHNMFIGIGASVLLLLGSVSTLRKGSSPLGRHIVLAALLSLVTLVALVTTFKGFTLYRVVYLIPGLDALRSVTRIILVLLFPIGVVSAAGVMYLRLRIGRVGQGLGFLLAVLVVWEVHIAKQATYDRQADEVRVSAIANAAREAASLTERPILHVLSDPLGRQYLSHVDAMLASQRLGWPTIDAISGFYLSAPDLTCGTPAGFYSDFEAWLADPRRTEQVTRLKFERTDLLRRTVVVGRPTCSAMAYADAAVTSGDAPAPAAASQFTLEPGELQISHDVRATIRITNRSGAYLHARTSHPVRLSWRFVKESSPDSPGWDPRAALNADIPPGERETQTIAVVAPAQPGSYRLQVSIVADGYYWFHDHGLKILTFSEPIIIR